ncbi:hypothetical protein Naga_100004g120 [Nannochloropsis gaditana]|uniref:Uncharacterized protein n=1 Tax=Nannochloropsis gaditana TaxID=72520 RepID=W7TXH7_9STRA|nr:hypothetical protein Naga_100004g120 [Nannochloropsis gaditana]
MVPVLPLTATGQPTTSLLSSLGRRLSVASRASLLHGRRAGRSTSREGTTPRQLLQEGSKQGHRIMGVDATKVGRIGDEIDGATRSENSNDKLPPSSSPSQAAWREQLRKTLRGKLMLVTNAWTATLILTILLAVVFRALQPTEEPGLGVTHYAWRGDPSDPNRLSLEELDLDVRGIGRFKMEFGPSKVQLYPMEADEEVRVGHRDEAALADFLLAEISMPSWNVTLGHDFTIVSAVKASTFFSARRSPLTSKREQVILSGNFHGYVTLFASLPSRIFLKCYLQTDLASVEGSRCESQYLPDMRRGGR